MVDLLDASDWLALSAPDHTHYERARQYWEREAAERAAFCRITALALLRLLTNQHVLGAAALSGEAAWRALATWLAMPGVEFWGEPAAVDEFLRDCARRLDLRAGHWTDACLAAFAAAGNCRLVSFDRDFLRFPGIVLLRL